MINTSKIVTDHLTELEIAMQGYMAFILSTEHRSFSYLDFMHFEVEGREYTITHGTFRNKISKLREQGIVELAYNSGIAFYNLKGVKIGKQATTSMMTRTHIGVLLKHIHRVPNIKKHPLYKYLKHHSFDRAAVHDLHLRFATVGLWSLISDSTNSTSGSNNYSALETDPFSKDIRLEKRVINDLDIQVTVHHPDTVTVVIGCSSTPIIVDEYGVIRLSEALPTIEDELYRLIEQCSNNGINSGRGVGDGHAPEIPNHMSWTVTRWDFGVDGLVTYTGEKFFFSWGSAQNVLIVFYTKKWGENNYRIRVEFQEFPNKPLAVRERLSPKKRS